MMVKLLLEDIAEFIEDAIALGAVVFGCLLGNRHHVFRCEGEKRSFGDRIGFHRVFSPSIKARGIIWRRGWR